MKLFNLILLMLMLQINAEAQNTPTKKQVGAEPYPAPVSYKNISMDQAEFIKLFESKNVGNLHVYPLAKQDKPSEFFEGKPIDSGFSNLLTGDLAKQSFIRNEEPRALFSIRGNGEELYIIRLPSDVSGGEIALYGWNNGKMDKRQTLATYDCTRNHCVQVDSWIQDVNGDTRLDVVQVKRTTRDNGKKVKIDKTVYLMDDNGLFKKSKYNELDFANYQVQ
ncbi:MAG: hypothetical protein GC192_23875 [Bacteroidetes bacterium]|nr:hypothetical protein [Bacteroidota bacterium]